MYYQGDARTWKKRRLRRRGRDEAQEIEGYQEEGRGCGLAGGTFSLTLVL